MGAQPAFDSVPVDDERYTLRSRPEIVGVLRSLEKQHSMITVHFDQGRDFILTTILDVNADRQEIVLDLGAETRANKLLLQSARLLVVGYEDRIKVQFATGQAEGIMHDRQPAFRVRIPGAVVRLQRRDFYRVQLPMGKPIKAYLQPIAGRPGMLHEARLVDLSCGGVAMILNAIDESIAIGHIYPACSINLPGVGTVSAPVQITYQKDIAQKNGTRHWRLGCRFIKLPGPMQSMIQRYINRLELERNPPRR